MFARAIYKSKNIWYTEDEQIFDKEHSMQKLCQQHVKKREKKNINSTRVLHMLND